MVILVPPDSSPHTIAKLEARGETQLVARRLDVAPPVALSEDVKLVVVEHYQLSGGPAHILSHERDKPQHPYRGGNPYPPRLAQLLVYVVAESGALVHVAIRQEILSSRHAVVKGEKHRLHEILHVDEGDVLRR